MPKNAAQAKKPKVLDFCAAHNRIYPQGKPNDDVCCISLSSFKYELKDVNF